jgi:hypothetical protein
MASLNVKLINYAINLNYSIVYELIFSQVRSKHNFALSINSLISEWEITKGGHMIMASPTAHIVI